MVADETGQTAAIEGVFTDLQSDAKRKTFAAGEHVFDEGQRSANVMYIHVGEVRVFQIATDGSVRLGGVFGPGEWVGAAAVAGLDFRGRAVASVETSVSMLPADRLMDLLQLRPAAAVAFFREATQRLMRAYDDTLRLMFNDCNARLIDTLIDLSTYPSAEHVGDDVTVHITHQQLAQAVGAARETISLALTELRHKNLLRTGRSRLTFNPQLLLSFKASAAEKPRRDRTVMPATATSVA